MIKKFVLSYIYLKKHFIFNMYASLQQQQNWEKQEEKKINRIFKREHIAIFFQTILLILIGSLIFFSNAFCSQKAFIDQYLRTDFSMTCREKLIYNTKASEQINDSKKQSFAEQIQEYLQSLNIQTESLLGLDRQGQITWYDKNSIVPDTSTVSGTNQKLVLSGNILTITGGNSITLPTAGGSSSTTNNYTTNTSNTYNSTLNLAPSGVTPGTYGSQVAIPQFTVGADGRITSATSHIINYESPLTFENGLSRTGNKVELGGTLGHETTLSLNGNYLNMTGIGKVGIGTSTPSSKLSVIGDVLYSLPPDPTNASATIIYNDTGWFWNENVQHNAHIYAYKETPEGKVFSAGYTTLPTNLVDNNQNNSTYDVELNWDAVPGADGYRVFSYLDYYGVVKNYDHYIDVPTNSFLINDDNFLYGSEAQNTLNPTAKAITAIGDSGFGTLNPQHTVHIVAPIDRYSLYSEGGKNYLQGATGVGMLPNTTDALAVGGSFLSTGKINTNSKYQINSIDVLKGTPGPWWNGNNFMVGFNAGPTTTGFIGYENLFIGSYTGNNINSESIGNVFLGHHAGFSITKSESNTFIGGGSGYSVTTGIKNTFLGDSAGRGVTTGSRNIIIGQGAGWSFNGNWNTIIGVHADADRTSGDYHVLLGYGTNAVANGLFNAAAIGSFARVGQSSAMALGGTGVFALDVGISTENPTAKLDVVGTADKIQLKVRANATQNANIQEWQNYAGTVLAAVDKNGNLSTIRGVNYVWPAANGANGTVLTNDGTGGLTWNSVSCSGCFSNGGNSFGSIATLGTNDLNNLAFETNNVERMRIDTNGNIGIGTTPTSGVKLLVNGIISSPDTGSSSERFGLLSSAAGNNSVAIGVSSNALGDQSISIGQNSKSAYQSTVVGVGSRSDTAYNVFLGSGITDTSGGSNVALGTNVGIQGNIQSVVTGYVASSTNGSFNAVYGATAKANGVGYATSLGYAANTSTYGGIALGANALTTAGGQFVVGGNYSGITNMYVGAGVVNTNSFKPTTTTINATGGSGTDITGSNLGIAGGRSTGTANGGSIIFSTAQASGVSSTTLNTLTERMRIASNGNIGIGTQSPNALLDVRGKGMFGNQLAANFYAADQQLAVSHRYTDLSTYPNTLHVATEVDPSADGGFATGIFSQMNSRSGNTRNNTSLYGAVNQARHLGSGTASEIIASLSNAYSISPSTTSNLIGGRFFTVGVSGTTSQSKAIDVTYGGAIGTINYNYGLHINQAAGQSLGVLGDVNLLLTTTATPNISGNYAIYSNIARNSYLNGNLGLGTINPTMKLDVLSDSATNYATRIFNDGNNSDRYGLLVQSGLDDQSLAGPSTLVQFNDGDGTAVGSITFGSNATSYNTTSDIRLKENITASSIGVNDLMKIKISDFTWKGDISKKITHGLIAQELLQVYPQAVTVLNDPNQMMMVDYSKLTPLVIKSIQDQNNTLQSLKLNVDNVTQTIGSVNTSELQASTEFQQMNKSIEEVKITLGDLSKKVATQQDNITDLIKRLDSIYSKDSTPSGMLASLQQRVEFLESMSLMNNATQTSQLLSSTESATLSENSNLTINSLLVSSKTNLNELTVMGDANFGLVSIKPIDASIDALGVPLKLQGAGSGPIRLMADRIEVTTNGNLILKQGSLQIEKGVIQGNDSIRGKNVVVTAQSSEVMIKFPNKRENNNYAVSITPNWLTSVAVKNKQDDGFTILFETSAPNDAKVDWIIID